MRTAKALIGLLMISVFMPSAPVRAAEMLERPAVMVISDVANSNYAYVEFVNIFNALIVERLKKIKEPESDWGVLILRNGDGKIVVAVVREEDGARPILIAALDETADFSQINAAVSKTVEVIQRGGRGR